MNSNAERQAAMWPADKLALLIELQAAGKSFSEIGSVIGKSRNAVAGKCTRLELTAAPIDRAIHAARSAVRHHPVAARGLPKAVIAPCRRKAIGFKTKSELRAMLHDAIVNTARMSA